MKTESRQTQREPWGDFVYVFVSYVFRRLQVDILAFSGSHIKHIKFEMLVLVSVDDVCVLAAYSGETHRKIRKFGCGTLIGTDESKDYDC